MARRVERRLVREIELLEHAADALVLDAVVCTVAADDEQLVVRAGSLVEHRRQHALRADRLEDDVLGHALGLFGRDLAGGEHARDLGLVLGELHKGGLVQQERAAVAHVADEIAPAAGDDGGEGGAQARADGGAVGVDEVVKRLEEHAPHRLDGVEVKRAGVGRHALHEHGQLGVKPLREATDHGRAGEVAGRETTHTVAHHGHGDLTEGGLGNLDAAGILVDLLAGAHLCGCCHERHRSSTCSKHSDRYYERLQMWCSDTSSKRMKSGVDGGEAAVPVPPLSFLQSHLHNRDPASDGTQRSQP